jgi:hypothetical protein
MNRGTKVQNETCHIQILREGVIGETVGFPCIYIHHFQSRFCWLARLHWLHQS